jgi:hypothetical protein
MAKKPENHSKPWSDTDLRALKKLAEQNTPTRVMAIKLKRTPDSVQSKALQQGVSLKPVNQRPYNRQPKKR